MWRLGYEFKFPLLPVLKAKTYQKVQLIELWPILFACIIVLFYTDLKIFVLNSQS